MDVPVSLPGALQDEIVNVSASPRQPARASSPAEPSFASRCLTERLFQAAFNTM